MKGILWTVAVICIIIWLLGIIGVGILKGIGGLIHILLVIAVISIVYNLLTGRKPLD